MAHPTYPAVFYDDAAGSWKCEMRDKKTGRTWGIGYGATRKEAIYNARSEQPENGQIKRAIGWATCHPFLGGAAVGIGMAYHHAKQNQTKMRFGDMITAGVVCGTIAWAIVKIAELFNSRQVSFWT